jgi:hypothetical protein
LNSIVVQRTLVCHPDTPAAHRAEVVVHMQVAADSLELTYQFRGGLLRLPQASRSIRTDGLWKTSCFELFVMPHGGLEYLEFNFSPAGPWAAYRFDGYRDGMLDFDTPAPKVTTSQNYGTRVRLTLTNADLLAASIGLAAVIEEYNGTKSYWALAHPPGKPDFHHPDCFAVILPAAEAP